MYYNPSTQEQKSLNELKDLFNASIPDQEEEVNGWYLIHEGTQPEADDTHRVVRDSIQLIDERYTQTYILEELTSEEIAANEERAAEEHLAQAKAARAEAVSRITVEVGGMVFDGDEKAQDRMSRVAAIASEEELSTELPWVLADNTVATVTVAQIKEALRKALYAQAELWIAPYTGE